MLKGLNPNQLDAVTTDKNALVIACPGSGKTRVLTRKIAYELERLESKKKFIIALTYTNRAAEEIQRRLDELGIPQEQLWAGTIHSFCYQWIIKPYSAYEPALVHGFSIIDDNKKRKILSEIKKKHSVPSYSDINTSLDRNENYINDDPYNNTIAKEFHISIIENKEIDFDLLINYAYKLLKSHSKIRSHLANLFSYVFVDEFQDTQDLQYAIIGQIISEARDKCKLFLVGDPDQAIYGSLGGRPKSLYEIQEEIGNQEIVFKEIPGNYRSTQRIVDFFRNFQSTEVNIEALGQHASESGIITLNTATNKENLYKEFADIIIHNLKNAVKPSEICIIAPQWYFLTPLAQKLKSILPDIPFDAPGVSPLPTNRENFWWKLSRLFLTEIAPETSMSRFRWMNQIIDDLNGYTSGSLGNEYADCRRNLKIINSIRPNETIGILYLEEACKAFFERLNLDISISSVLVEQWDIFFDGIRKKYESTDFIGTPDDVQYFKSIFKPSTGVVINTCHGVKGEEFETVIAFGLHWGYVPHWNCIRDQPYYIAESASKKLLYVIGSRAKKICIYLLNKGERQSQDMNIK
ncbi:UvrD-helicase domain-containing protein [Cytobacillus firmus]|uniref:UvrD-helicase domain-containing protein n=1 Tax=Cytobacillus firmus TaxID=1399 RepID=UPI001C98AD0A|nr:ATP-dependent helicase [Cytobacillus firmus]MBY6052778.1 ATP-dependent helicase [Cytobacillus firmus]